MSITLVRFVIVGSVSAAIYFLLCYGQLLLGMRPFFAGIISYAITFGFTFYVQHHWTFGTRVPCSRTLPRYFAMQLLAASVSSGLTEMLGAYYGWTSFYSALFVTIFASAASFCISKFWVFSE